jgi:hypothetical protein
VPGFPIRTPSDQRSVDSSPRTIAASHVLHRLLVPRHPPCALDNLTNTHIKKSRHKCAQKQKMLASTVQFSTTTRTEAAPHPKAKPAPTVQRGHPLRTQQRAEPTSSRRNRQACLVFPLFSSNPLPPPSTLGEVLEPSTTDHERTEHTPVNTPGRRRPVKLLRKEVIQPHLPVRLPCYDFVPIASPTFDRSPPCGLGHGLRVLPTFVT